jgi:hypothetical protein
MSRIFHQNMLNYGGNVLRTAAYFNQFRNIDRSSSAFNRIDVAGFTEITNGNTAITGLSILTGALFNGGRNNRKHQLAVVKCGRTALGKFEFTGFAVRSGIRITQFGRVAIRSGSEVAVDWAPVSDYGYIRTDIPRFTRWSQDFDGSCLADYRVVVFARLTLGIQDVVVGFVHNMYTLDVNRTDFMQKLSKMMDKINLGRHIYIGGDFNVSPKNIGNERSGLFYKYTAPLIARPAGIDADNFTGGGTLLSGRLYDYWFSDIRRGSINTPRPSVYSGTLNKDIGLSDHCGVLLNI